MSISDLHLDPCATGPEHVGRLSNSWDCCVLLAACGRDEHAKETPDGGLFTQALLNCLTNLGMNRLTYKQLIRSMEITGR